MSSKLLQVKGKFEDQSGVRHLIAGHLKGRSDLLDRLDMRSRKFHCSASGLNHRDSYFLKSSFLPNSLIC